MSENATTSLILTVLNEGESINRLLDSILAQSRLPDEIVVVDGGSVDDTVARIQAYADRLPLRVIVYPGCNISEGRNRAIREADGAIIAVTDAGVRLAPEWFERITQPLIDKNDVEVVAGFFEADPSTLFETAMGAAVLPLVSEIDPQTFLPSSRSIAFYKSAALQIGGYPEWLDYCEDLVFDLRLKQSSPSFAFAPDALVYFRPRSSLESYFKQYYRYARGDGKADLWRKRHAIRYVTYLFAAPLLFVLGIIRSPLYWGLLLVGGLAYIAGPLRRLPMLMRRAPDHSVLSWIYVTGMIPVLRLVGDVAKLIGYPVGRYWRWRYRPPDWRTPRV